MEFCEECLEELIYHYSSSWIYIVYIRLWLFPACRAFASQTWISWLSGAWTARPLASGTPSTVGMSWDLMGCDSKERAVHAVACQLLEIGVFNSDPPRT